VLKRKLQLALILLPLGLAAVSAAGLTVTPVAAQAEIASAPLASPSPSASGDQKRVVLPVRYREIGKSVKGTPIMAAIYGSGKKRVIVFGGIHGNEPDSSIVAKALMGSLMKEPAPDDLTIIIVADANPDGLFANTRVNARGVDINRNFPSASWSKDYWDTNQFPGAQPVSEPETQAIMKLLESSPPDYIITLHAALGCVNWDGTGEPLARVIADVNKYPLCPYLGYETPGSLGTLMGTDKKLPVVTIELRNIRAADLVQQNLPALRALLSHIASSR